MKKLTILLPENLNINELVNSYPKLKLDVDYLKYLIYHILSKLAFQVEENKENDIDILHTYAGINSQKLLVDNTKHKEHIEFLQQPLIQRKLRLSRTKTRIDRVSILYRTPYEVSKKSYSYKLSSLFHKSRLKIDYIKNVKLINKIYKDETKQPNIIKNGTYKFLNKFFDKTRLTIDLEQALQLCEARYKEHKEYNTYLKEANQLLNLHNGIYKISYNPDTDRRIHSNITSLPKVYRKFITYDSKPLVEVDISNSILYFLSMFITVINKQDIIEDTTNSIYNYIYYNRESNLPLMLGECLKTISNKEVELLKKHAIQGNIYELFIPDFEQTYTEEQFAYHYQKEYKELYTGKYQQKRKVVKDKVLRMLFAQTHFYQEEQKIFRTKFPTLMEAINNIKTKYPHTVLSYLLLQMESYFVLNCVAREFNQKYWREAPLFTLHDCLITTVDYKKELECIMKDNLAKNLGSAPKLKSTDW